MSGGGIAVRSRGGIQKLFSEETLAFVEGKTMEQMENAAADIISRRGDVTYDGIEQFLHKASWAG